jgi:LysM repeat protein
MSRVTLKGFVTLFSAGLLFFLVGFSTAHGQGRGPTLAQPQDDFLDYRLRRGESLGDVAQIFRIPAAELARINRITDPTRMQVDQVLKIPNVFARQVAELREERDRLLTEKAQAAQQLREGQQVLATKEQALQKTESEKNSFARQLAAVGHWRLGAQALSLALFVTLMWGLFINKDRARHSRRIAALAQENTALDVAKEKYRLAVAQLEFRYQKLYSGRSEKPSQLALEGATLLTQTFTTGCGQLEQLLAGIKSEREKEEQLLQAEQRILDLVRHPFREFQQWYRLKYYSAQP